MVALFGNRCNLGSFQTSGNVEDKREALMTDVIKGIVISRLSLTDSNWHLFNPRSLIRRHCIYDVRDLFTINIIKCKLLTSRKTARSKSAFIKNEVVPFSQRFDFGISCKSQLTICFSVLCV